MGAIAEALVAYARPLIDETDGSQEQLSKAFALSQLCYNLALSPEDSREKTLGEMRARLNVSDEVFDEFRRTVVNPMIRRHQEMFPLMHGRIAKDLFQRASSPPAQPKTAAPSERYPGTDRYAPCPCDSGEKYKFCCGKKGR